MVLDLGRGGTALSKFVFYPLSSHLDLGAWTLSPLGKVSWRLEHSNFESLHGFFPGCVRQPIILSPSSLSFLIHEMGMKLACCIAGD